MSDDLEFIAGETAIAVDALIAARIASRDVDIAVERLAGWLTRLATVTPFSARKMAALRESGLIEVEPGDAVTSPAFRLPAAPIARATIQKWTLRNAKEIVARAYEIDVAELESRLDREQLTRGLRRYLERLCWDDEDIRLLLSHRDIGLIDKEV